MRIFFPPPLFGEKEKSLSFCRIVNVWDKNRSADRIPEIMLFIRRIWMIGIPAGFPRPRIEHVVAQIFERAPMETTRARLSLYLDGSGSIASILRAIIRSQHLEFRDRFN